MLPTTEDQRKVLVSTYVNHPALQMLPWLQVLPNPNLTAVPASLLKTRCYVATDILKDNLPVHTLQRIITTIVPLKMRGKPEAQVDFTQLVMLIHKVSKHGTDSERQQLAFDCFDITKKGYIKGEDFKSVLSFCMGWKMTEHQIDELAGIMVS